MSERTVIEWAKDDAGVVVLTIDDPGQRVNTLTSKFAAALVAAVTRVEQERDSISGVVITSGKSSFFAGGDLKRFLTLDRKDAQTIFDELESFKAQLRKLETLGVPVVAAINGAALGGGFEIALACHQRIIADVKGAAVGLPEVTLGLLPGGGGVTRITRLLGIERGFRTVLADGKSMGAARAKELGVIDTIVDSVDELLPAAKAWIAVNPQARQPWDDSNYTIPGGTSSDRVLAEVLPVFPATLRSTTHGAPMPAPRAVLAAAVEGAQVDFDTASRIESRYFAELVTGQTAKNMIQTLFFDLKEVNSGASRPTGFPAFTARKVAVLGAGMMGSAIAYACAVAGIDVVLKDVTLDAANKGKEYAVSALKKAVSQGKLSREHGDTILSRIHPSVDTAAFTDIDLVIEAVFESLEVKHAALKEVEPLVDTALLATNTSTLPINELAEGVGRRADFIGLHFFSPADKMPLLEIIKGADTSDASLAKAIDFAMQLKKTPVVANDSHGFFTSRVIATRVMEALTMLAEGIDPATIERAGRRAGYPSGPLQLADELTLTLCRTIGHGMRDSATLSVSPDTFDRSGAALDTMIDRYGRPSRAHGAGFYDYADGQRVGLWPELRQVFSSRQDAPLADVVDRLLFAEVIETRKCLDENVITARDANVGSILGIGFPAWTGGAAQFIIGYPGGPGRFRLRAQELAAKYGPRFAAPQSIRD